MDFNVLAAFPRGFNNVDVSIASNGIDLLDHVPSKVLFEEHFVLIRLRVCVDFTLLDT